MHLSLAVPASLKRKVEQAAKKRGWSISNEAAHRLEMSFSNDLMTDALMKAIRREFTALGGRRGVRGLLADAVEEKEGK